MDDAVAAEDVDGDDARVEVDGQTTRTDVGAQALRERTVAKLVGLQESGDGARDKDTAGGVEPES